MSDNFEAYIDPKDLAEFHLVMEKLEPDKLIDRWRNLLVPLKRDLRNYPPPPENSKYIRTNNLKRNWQYVVHSPKYAEMSNAAIYAGWVMGVEQAGIHEGRWRIAFKVAEEHLEKFVQFLSDKVAKTWIR